MLAALLFLIPLAILVHNTLKFFGFLTGNAKRAEELPADLWRAKGTPGLEGIVRQFAEEKSATPGQVALACNRSINSRSGIAWLREADITSPRR